MAAPELAVLQGVKAYIDNTANEKGKSSNPCREEAWIGEVCAALKDIENGLGKVNRTKDKEYHRTTITSLFLAKVLEGEELLCPCTSEFEEYFSHKMRFVPDLNWYNFFHIIFKANLVNEFIHLIMDMSADVQNVIFERLKKWMFTDVLGTKEGNLSQTNFSFLDILAFCISLFIHTCLVTLCECGDTSDILKNITCVAESLCEQVSRTENEDSFHYCENLFENLHSFMIKKLEKMKQVPLGNIDVLHLGRLGQTLSNARLGDLTQHDYAEKSKVLLHKIGKLDCALQSDDSFSISNISSCLEDIESCKICLQKCVSKLDTTEKAPAVDHLHKDVIDKLQSVFALLQSFTSECENFEESLTCKETAPSSYLCDLHGITFHLEGYDNMVKDLLLKIGENPLAHRKWEEAFVCLNAHPECLARCDVLLSVVDTISKINDVEIYKENVSSVTEVARALQEVFWSAFSLLSLKSRMKLCEIIVSDSTKLMLISEYPLLALNKETSSCRAFHMQRKKKLNACFNSFVSAKSANDTVLSNLSETVLSWPGGTIKKLVEQALRNQQQVELLVDVLKHFIYLCNFKKDGTDDSMLWKCLHDDMYAHWRDGENNFVENSLKFIHTLLQTASDSPPVNHLLHEICMKSLMPSFDVLKDLHEKSKKGNENSVLPELLGVKMLSCVIETLPFFDSIETHELAGICLTLGAAIDKSCQFWISNPHFDVESYELEIECFDFLTSKLTGELQNMKQTDEESYHRLMKWIIKMVSCFRWMTQIRFLSITKLYENHKVPVPESLAEVCVVPDILECSDKLSYGPGTGLVPWHQCFVTDPSLCPLSSLDIDTLTEAEIDLFSSGWIVTLAQVLPFCLPYQWYTLFEASKVLITDFKLFVPYEAGHVNVLPVLDFNECYTILGVAQVLHRVTSLLGSQCCIQWTSQPMWLHVSKCFCMIISRLVNDSAEFAKANADSQLFMISQMFCKVIDFMLLLQTNLPGNKSHKTSIENAFILSLDLLANFEKIWRKNNYEGGDFGTEDSLGSDSEESLVSLELKVQKLMKLRLEVNEHIKTMQDVVSVLPTAQHQDALRSKLNSINPVRNLP